MDYKIVKLIMHQNLSWILIWIGSYHIILFERFGYISCKGVWLSDSFFFIVNHHVGV